MLEHLAWFILGCIIGLIIDVMITGMWREVLNRPKKTDEDDAERIIKYLPRGDID